MPSSVLYCLPNPSMNSATFTADSIPLPCSLRQDSLPMLKSNPFPSTTSLPHCNYQQPHSGIKLDSTSSLAKSRTIRSSTKSMALKLASAWREIQGLNNWENLVEPLDPLLRQEIIRYGELVAACYKAFDLDPNSKRYLNCKYGKQSMLRQVGLGDSGYEVTKYIYATAPDVNMIPIQTSTHACGARWIGYVAASTDKQVNVLGRRDIIITFRGTVTNTEWIANLMSSLTPARLDPHNPRPNVKVESGFLSLYTSNERGSSSKFGLASCREQLLSEVSRLINKHKDEEISITLAGHSMGSSLALLLAYDIAELGLINRPPIINVSGRNCYKDHIPVTVFSFGGPRVGNLGFKRRCEELGVKVLRVVNVNDPITKLPGVVFNENFRGFRGTYEFPWSCSCYAHVGVELLLDFFKMHNPSCVHDLENYIVLLKSCPKSLKKDHGHIEQTSSNLMEKAKGFLLGGAQSFDALQWRNAAINMLNLVQSQWT